MTTHDAYRQGWAFVMTGSMNDPRYGNPYPRDLATKAWRYAWDAGALAAMEAEDGEEPDPQAAGF